MNVFGRLIHFALLIVCLFVQYLFMIYVRLAGGLGNQLFQLAAALTLQQRVSQEVVLFTAHLDRYALSRPFMLDAVVGNTFTKGKPSFFIAFISRFRLNKVLPFLFPWYVHNKNIATVGKRSVYLLDDYFQQIELVLSGITILCERLQQFASEDRALQNRFEFLTKGLSIHQLAAVHIRRADYTTTANRKVYCYLSDAYYKKAIAALPDNVTHIFVFTQDQSEDLSGCTDKQIVYIRDRTLRDVDEFLLMRMFRHFIIANSTFSFWAAQSAGVAGEGEIVGVKVAPKNWFCDAVANTLWLNNFTITGFITV
jgi:hypothetical protein